MRLQRLAVRALAIRGRMKVGKGRCKVRRVGRAGGAIRLGRLLERVRALAIRGRMKVWRGRCRVRRVGRAGGAIRLGRLLERV